MASVKLSSIINGTALVKDIRKLSSGKQTSSLECFHSIVNQFAPKMKAYSYFGITQQVNVEICQALVKILVCGREIYLPTELEF